MSNTNVVSFSPHIHDKTTTSRIMLDVIIALCPAFVAAVWIFGTRAAIVTFVCVAACVVSEWAFQKITKRPNTINDFSAVITGMILAFNLPVTIPLWQAVFGSAFAIVIVKQLYGGIGKNFVNPALTARIVMFLAFATPMTTWVAIPLVDVATAATPLAAPVDVITAATPLALISSGRIEYLPSMMDMFIGMRGGSLGETSNIALLIGGLYLLFRRVITWHTPVTFIGTVVLMTAALGQEPMYQLFAGGLFLGAIFMATDYPTSPQTSKGRIVFGIGCGLLTALIRVYGGFPEGVSFAILFMSMLVPYINKVTQSKALGGKKE